MTYAWILYWFVVTNICIGTASTNATNMKQSWSVLVYFTGWFWRNQRTGLTTTKFMQLWLVLVHLTGRFWRGNALKPLQLIWHSFGQFVCTSLLTNHVNKNKSNITNLYLVALTLLVVYNKSTHRNQSNYHDHNLHQCMLSLSFGSRHQRMEKRIDNHLLCHEV